MERMPEIGMSEDLRGVMLTLLRIGEPRYVSVIASNCGLSSEGLTQLLTLLQDNRLVKIELTGGETRVPLWSLTDEGTDLAKLMEALRVANAPPLANTRRDPGQNLRFGRSSSLRALRVAAGLTAGQVATRLETRPNLVSGIEAASSPMLSDVGRFLGALGGDLFPLARVGLALVPIALIDAQLDTAALQECLNLLGMRIAAPGSRDRSPFLIRQMGLADLRKLALLTQLELALRFDRLAGHTGRLDRMSKDGVSAIEQAPSVGAETAARYLRAVPAHLVAVARIPGGVVRVRFRRGQQLR